MTEAKIPFVDLALQHHRVADAVREGFDRVLSNTSFILGPEVEQFEREYAAFCGVEHCVGVRQWHLTAVTELALRAAGIGPGDEVIIPANTFVATAGAVARTGAEVVLADCREDYLIDPASVADKVTSKTRAVLPVHLYGQMAPVDEISPAISPDVLIIEDAAQSQGALRFGKRSGSLGNLAATSFYPGKNLGAYGDAGAVTTDDETHAAALRRLRNHGGSEQGYEHLEIGFNSRLDSLQAVVPYGEASSARCTWNDERRATRTAVLPAASFRG